MTHSPSEPPSLEELRAAAARDFSHSRALAEALMGQARSMSSPAQVPDSVELITEAVSLYRRLVENDRAALPDLAAALNNLGTRLEQAGDLTAAVRATAEAVEMYRQLSDDDRSYLANLANASSNLGIQFNEAGDSFRAQRATEETVTLYRQLATGEPVHLPHFAAALMRLAEQLFARDDLSAALLAAEEAVAVYRRLTEVSGEKFRASLTSALNLLTRLQAMSGEARHDAGTPVGKQVHMPPLHSRRIHVRTSLSIAIGALLGGLIAFGLRNWEDMSFTFAVGGLALAAIAYAAAHLARGDHHRVGAVEIDLISTQRGPSSAQVHDGLEQFRVVELFARAVEQLGSNQPVVRLGGLYVLENMGQLVPSQRQAVVNVICAYLRRSHAVTIESPLRQSPANFGAETRLRTAAQRILTVHLRPGPDAEQPADTYWPDIDLDLSHTHLTDFDLSGAHLRSATFKDVHFATPARFTGTRFDGVVLFEDTHFAADVILDRVLFVDEVSFRRVQFAGGVILDEASFRDDIIFAENHVAGYASFTGANFLRRVHFGEVHFAQHVRLTAAAFADGVWFNEVHFNGRADFDHCEYRDTVRFNAVDFGSNTVFDRSTFMGDMRFNDVIFRANVSFFQARLLGATIMAHTDFVSQMPDELVATQVDDSGLDRTK